MMKSDLNWQGIDMPRWLTRSLFGVTLGQIVGVLALIFLALFIRRVVFYLVASKVRRLASSSSPHLEESIKRSALPLSGLSVAAVFALGFPLLSFGGSIDHIVSIAVRIIASGSAILFFYQQIDLVAELFAARARKTESKLDDQLVPLLRRTAKAFVITIGTIFVLQNLDVDVGSLIAGLGLGGLAFALAAKDTLANTFGSLVIFIDRPFQIGDWVLIDGVEGVVEDVGFRTTRIRTFYNSLVTVPNAKLTASAIDNMGRRKYRRLKMTLSLVYSTRPAQIEAFVEGLRAIVVEHDATRKDYYEIHFNAFNHSSLDVLFYIFFEVANWSEELGARHQVLLAILSLAERLGISFAFPTRTLHMATPEDVSVAAHAGGNTA